MSAIQNYYRELDKLRRIAGASNESALRQAFQFLLKTIGDEHQLILYPEYAFKSAQGNNLRADGALIDSVRLIHGWWEAKDEKDDLAKEIENKLAKGYPSDNIIFEDTKTAVLLQNGQQVMTCAVNNPEQLQKLLDSFFNYQSPEIINFNTARLKFLEELPTVAKALNQLLITAHQENKGFNRQAQLFLQLCQRSIGENVSASHIDEMLIQHILTDQIFRAIFPNSHFHQENHLARAINELEQCFFKGSTRQDLLKRLEPYFAAIRKTAVSAITSHEKQRFLKQVYEDFYSGYNPKDADRLGVVYTPNEAVQFMIEACDYLAQTHFNKKLQDSGLDILDPCTGTGTFVVGLLDYWRGQYTNNDLLAYKFEHEIHANEISILPYYIACLNIEQSYYELSNNWHEFNGACFVNTLDNWGFEQKHQGSNYDVFGSVTDENQARIQMQNERVIPIIMGNPPYNANQKNENDNNKNDKAQLADQRIKETYLAQSTAQKTKLYDPYIRFFRWASDRLAEQGIVAFITNRSYLDARQADGFRKTIANEFQQIFIIDLMSDVRKNPKLSGTKHNIFGIQTGVAIIFLVRNPKLETNNIYYLSLDDFMTAVEKRRWLQHNTLRQLIKTQQFITIKPNAQGTWLNQAKESEEWNNYLPLASKDAKLGKAGANTIFKLHSLGISTNRDEWVYGMSSEQVASKIEYFMKYYDSVKNDSKNYDGGIKWSRNLKRRILSDRHDEKYSPAFIENAIYRPYVIKKIYRSKLLIDERGSIDLFFPVKNKVDNTAICINGITSNKCFESIAVNKIPDLHFYGDTVTLPLWIYADNGEKQDNITNWALEQFQTYYSSPIDSAIGEKTAKAVLLQKIDIFYYVYAVLHDPRYKEKFALNLKAEFPRIPLHSDFNAWAAIGEKLLKLHVNFNEAKPYPLKRVELKHNGAIKCKLKADKPQQLIDIDSSTQLCDIPAQAWAYQLGNRSALEWVLDQYKEKTPKDLTIREQFNHYRFADYKEQVIELLMKVCTVSIETVALIEQIKLL